MKGTGNKYNTVYKIIRLSALSALFMLASCHEDDYSMESGVTLEPVISNGLENVITTRAAVNVTGSGYTYDDDNVLENTVMLVYAIPTDNNPASEDYAYGTFRYRNGKWRSSVTANDGKNYNIYAISPSTFPATLNCWEDHSVSVNNAALTFNGLDLITSADPMVSIAAAGKHTMLDHNDNDIEKQVNGNNELETLVPPTLTKGSYSIGQVVKPAEGSTDNFYRVWMAMDHLYSKVTLSFCIDETYNQIRHIQINSAKLVVSNSERKLTGNHTYSYTDGLLLNSPSFGSGNETGDLEVDLLSGPSSTAVADQEKELFTLTPEYKEYGWLCILPVTYTGISGTALESSFPTARLVVNYDVWCQDMNDPDKWKVVRDDQIVENAFPLKQFKKTDGAPVKPKPGDHFIVKVKIKPTYLYQLADDDAKLELIIE